MPVSVPTRLVRLLAAAAAALAFFPAPSPGATPSLDVAGDFWSFQPVHAPVAPRDSGNGWALTEIDRFVLAALHERGLEPSPPASRRELIRRVTLDLTGLPPSPDDVTAFESDTSPLAYPRLVERLLASPHHGERWGRWWLDVARYADTNGQDENKVMANAWRYRDWVVRSFNANTPFDTFIILQLAGDLLPLAATASDAKTKAENETETADRLIATGFLVLGPKMLAEQDKPKLVMDIVDEQIDTVGRAFLGLTLGCARCHDHKFDPVPARDYYALAGIFRSTRTMENLGFVSKFNERRVSPAAEVAAFEDHRSRLNAITNQIHAIVREADAAFGTWLKPASKPAPPPNDDSSFHPETVQDLVARLGHERDALAASPPPEPAVALAVTEDPPTDLPIHVRGSHLNLEKDPVPRGFLQAITRVHPQPPLPTHQSGRLELARWIASPANPLTARVIVNRVWQAHFAEGLVSSPDNFGLRGEKPTHPDLLDWLADRFVRSGWDLKALHRLILASAVYQQTSTLRPDPEARRLDPGNRLLHRYPRRRMEAEMIRDSLLAVSGLLDPAIGGSLVGWKNDEYAPADDVSESSRRRTLYLPIVRDRVYDALTLFDFANPGVSTARRVPTIVSQQALFFLNSPLVKGAAAANATALRARLDLDNPGRIDEAYRRILGRLPTPAERDRSLRFLAVTSDSDEPCADGPGSPEAWTALCQALLASNEFIYRP